MQSERDIRDAKKRQADMNLDTQEQAMRFAEYDENGDCKLDWDEFYAMQPKHLRSQFSPQVIRSWFDAADINGDGVLSINEFFLWTMSALRAWDCRLRDVCRSCAGRSVCTTSKQ